jgi:hypothetical protein
VKRAFQQLSRSIAYTRKSLKKQSYCYARILTSRPQAKLFDGISDGKKFPAIPVPGNTVNRRARWRSPLQIKASQAKFGRECRMSRESNQYPEAPVGTPFRRQFT